MGTESVTVKADWLRSTVITPACHEGAHALGSRPEQIQGCKAAGLPSIQIHLAGCQQHFTLVTQDLEAPNCTTCDISPPEESKDLGVCDGVYV